MLKYAVLWSLLLLLLSGCRGTPVVTISQASPDGAFEARLLDEPENSMKIGRNFSIEIVDLKNRNTNVILVRSADEGKSPNERFLWSKEGRYLLLVGEAFFTKPKWKLKTGEYLYLLYDNQERKLKINSFYSKPKAEHFGPEDLEEIEFAEKLVFETEVKAKEENQ